MSANRQFLNTERFSVKVPKLGRIVTAFFLGLIVLILAHSWSQAKRFVSPLEILLGTPQVPAREPIAFSQDDVTVYVPANATELEGSLSLAVAQPDLVLVVQNIKWIIPRVVLVEFLRPDGAQIPSISFSEPLEVCFTLAGDHWQAFMQDTGAYQVQYYVDRLTPSGWQSLPQITHPDRHQVCGQTDKLYMFGLAIRAQVGIPVTGITAGLAQMLVPPPVPTREHRERDTSASAPESIPTNAPINPPATQPPVVQPQLTDPLAKDNGKQNQPPGQQKQKEQQPKNDQNNQPNNDQKNDKPKDKKKN